MFSHQHIKKLSDMEFGIYKYILENKEKVPYMTIRELAKETNVSTASILRFCTKFEYDSYSQLKSALKEHLDMAEINSQPYGLEEILNYFQSIHVSDFIDELEKGAKLLRNADTIIFHGIGTSGILANYAAKYFSHSGIKAWADDDIRPDTNHISDKTVLFILSVSGDSPFVVENIAIYKRYNSKIMSITNTSKCSVSKMSDWNMNYNFNQYLNKNKQNITSQVPVLFILEALARRV